jgi:hypothetical protein
MKCEDYRKALIEGAASGEKFESRLAGHLEECAQCRAKLQHEEALFAAIDQALHTKVNEMPRDGFLTGVQARIREQAPSKSQWTPVLALTGAALALTLVAMLHPWTTSPSRPVEARKPHTESMKVSKIVPHRLVSEESEPKTNNTDARVRRPQSPALRPEGVQIASGELEVLVPPDEGKAFHQFVARLQGQEQVAQAVASPVVSSVPDEKNELPEIAPVEIAGLQLEPLSWENLRERKKIKIESLCNVITCQSYQEGR